MATHSTLASLFTDIANAIRTKSGSSDSIVADNFPTAIANIPGGITPTGNINITDTNQTDVTNYATAQVVDSDLVAGNIKNGVDILGVTGTYSGEQSGSVTYSSNGTYHPSQWYYNVTVDVQSSITQSNMIFESYTVDQFYGDWYCIIVASEAKCYCDLVIFYPYTTSMTVYVGYEDDVSTVTSLGTMTVRSVGTSGKLLYYRSTTRHTSWWLKITNPASTSTNNFYLIHHQFSA